MPNDEIAAQFIKNSILYSENLVIKQIFNLAWRILSNIPQGVTPVFYNKPYKTKYYHPHQHKLYDIEILKKLETEKLNGDVFEVKIDQHPDYYRILFVMENDSSKSYILFIFGFIKNHSIADLKTNLYCLYSDDIHKDRNKNKLRKGVDYE